MSFEFIESKNRLNSDNIYNPLVVIYGNIGSIRSNLLNVSDIWTLKGFNCIVYNPPLNSNSMLFYRKEIKDINDFILKYFDDNPTINPILSFHVIAGGASYLGYHLRLLNENKKFNHILHWIKGVVIDNGPFSNARSISKIFKKDLINSGNFNQYLLSFFLPLFLPFWIYYEKYDYPYLISNDNKWHILIIYNENDDYQNFSKSFIKTLKQRGNQFNEKNNDSDIMLFEKKVENSNDYIESTNQLIDLIIYNGKNYLNKRYAPQQLCYNYINKNENYNIFKI